MNISCMQNKVNIMICILKVLHFFWLVFLNFLEKHASVPE